MHQLIVHAHSIIRWVVLTMTILAIGAFREQRRIGGMGQVSKLAQ